MTKKKIEKLTDEQWADVYAYRLEVFEEMSQPSKADEAEIHAAMTGVYGAIGKEMPTLWIVESPIQAQKAIKVWPSIRGKTPSESLLADVTMPKDITWPWWSNGWSTSWRAWLSWCSKIVDYKPDDLQKLRIVERADRACGWQWCFDDVCIVSRRPTTRWTADRWDPNPPTLHCPDGPSVRFNDGWELYHWRGTRVPSEWILKPDTIDPSLALNHENVEQRRSLCEILGWDKVLQQLDAKTVDKDPDPEIGELLEVSLPDAPAARFLKVRCGTGRDFILPVPAEMTSALQANAWTYELEPEEYKPEFRT